MEVINAAGQSQLVYRGSYGDSRPSTLLRRALGYPRKPALSLLKGRSRAAARWCMHPI